MASLFKRRSSSSLVLTSMLIGLLWVPLAALGAKIPFALSGLLAGVWFAPLLFSAVAQKQIGSYRLGLLLLCEGLASAVAAALGPLGILSLQFGVAQGVCGEAVFRLTRSPVAAALGALFADISLMAFHPHLGILRYLSMAQWTSHIITAALSAVTLTLAIQALYKRSRQ